VKYVDDTKKLLIELTDEEIDWNSRFPLQTIKVFPAGSFYRDGHHAWEFQAPVEGDFDHPRGGWAKEEMQPLSAVLYKHFLSAAPVPWIFTKGLFPIWVNEPFPCSPYMAFYDDRALSLPPFQQMRLGTLLSFSGTGVLYCQGNRPEELVKQVEMKCLLIKARYALFGIEGRV
jgi:hypothetical protein